MGAMADYMNDVVIDLLVNGDETEGIYKNNKLDTVLAESLSIIDNILRRLREDFPHDTFILVDKGHYYDIDINSGDYHFRISKFLSNLLIDLKGGNPHLSEEVLKDFLYEQAEEGIIKLLGVK